MSSVVISGDTSGAITLAAPSVSGTNTITLPASTGTVLTTGSPQSGGVIQMVSTTYATQVSTTTSSAWVDTGLSATITPKFSTSKILVLVSQSYEQNITSSLNNAGASINILRGSTAIFTTVGNYGAIYQYFTPLTLTGRGMAAQIGSNVVDSPATTSATTYKVQMQTGTSGTMYFQSGNSTSSSIILMEIAA